MLDMNRRYPEEEGIPSLFLFNMMKRWEKDLCHVHGYVILRNGKLAAEAFRHPFSKESRRLVHSVSKTITAIGIGIAVDEGLLSVRDKVLSFFPEYRSPLQKAAYLSELTIQNLLTMSAGQEGDSIDDIYNEREAAWKSFLNLEIKNKPGTVFAYNSAATYMLSKILTIKTGMTLLEYLKPRLFEPLGITNITWDKMDGVNTGGWGCEIALEDMAKVGQLLLQKGKWGDIRLLSEAWVEEMSSKQIETMDTQVYEDWKQGYCYQMWRCSREGCYRADGAFGQYILVLPPKNMVAAIWSEDAYSQDMLNSFWEEVYDKIPDQSCGVDGKAYAVYQNYCREWGTPVRYPASFSYLETQVSEQEYVAVENSENPDNCVERIRFFFTDDDQLQIRFVKDEAVTTIYAGNTKAFIGETQQTFEIASFIRLKSLRKQPVLYAAHYHWMSERALLIHIDWLHTAHSTEITCLFGSEHITAVFTPSYEKFQIGGKSSPALCITSQSFIGKKHRVYKGSAD